MLRASLSIAVARVVVVSLLAHAGGCGDDDDAGGELDADAGQAPDGGGEDRRLDAGADRDATTSEEQDRDATASEQQDAAAGEDAGESPAPSIDIDALCDLLAEKAPLVICAGAENDAACRALVEAHESFLRCSALVAAVGAGRIAFDGQTAAACLEDDSDETLAEKFEGGYFDCAGAFEGQIGEGQDCYLGYRFADDECAQGLYCPGAGCPGQCRPYQALGASCPNAGRCAPSAACSYDCTRPCEGSCVEKPGEGEGCEPTQGICADGLICDASQQPYTCITPRASGDDCTRQYQCASGACVDGKCVDRPPNTCQDNADCDASEYCWRTIYNAWDCLPRLGADGQCSTGDDQCVAGLTCLYNSETGQELCRTSAGVDGDPCAPWGCEPDHYCATEGESEVCRPARAQGESCADAPVQVEPMNPPCQAGLHCMFSNGSLCLPPGAQGEPCYYGDVESCQPGLVCLGYALSTCQPPSAKDAVCNPMFDNACAAGLYCVCTGEGCEYTCADKLTNGEPCDEARVCASDYCDDSAAPVCADEPTLRARLCLPPP